MDSAILIYQFEISDFVLQKTLDGLTHDDSLAQPQLEGNCANWVLGHIIHSRLSGLEILGCDLPYPKEKFDRYQQGTKPLIDSSEALKFEELVECYNALQKPLLDGLKQITKEQLTAPAPFSPTNNPDETVGSLLAGLSFHEAYHSGQIALQRRIAGKPNVLG